MLFTLYWKHMCAFTLYVAELTIKTKNIYIIQPYVERKSIKICLLDGQSNYMHIVRYNYFFLPICVKRRILFFLKALNVVLQMHCKATTISLLLSCTVVAERLKSKLWNLKLSSVRNFVLFSTFLFISAVYPFVELRSEKCGNYVFNGINTSQHLAHVEFLYLFHKYTFKSLAIYVYANRHIFY